MKLWKKHKNEPEPTFKDKAKLWSAVVLLGLLAAALKPNNPTESDD